MEEGSIVVRGLTRRFGRQVAVEGLDLVARPGEILGFLGPNGAGKTTTMRMLTGYLLPHAGSASIAGFDVASETYEVRRRIGYLAERNPLYVEMRVADYLAHRSRLKGVPRRERRAAVGRAMEATGLAAVADKIIDTLSKGYRQRVGLADALVHDPEVLLLDEPTAGLDPNQVRTIREFLGEWSRERTVVLSTHVLGEVAALCHRAVVIARGRKVADGTVAELAAQGDGSLETAFHRLTTAGVGA